MTPARPAPAATPAPAPVERAIASASRTWSASRTFASRTNARRGRRPPRRCPRSASWTPRADAAG